VANIVLDNVDKYYGDLHAIDHLQLQIRDREFFVILGASGAGKTTTLKMMAGVEPVDSGSIFMDGQDVTRWPPERREVAMVFESYALYGHLSVYKNMAFPLLAGRRKRLTASEVEQKVRRVAQLLGIDMLLQRRPAELSGGQRQRVALGRALVREPAAFLMDEPLSHLDAKIHHQMRSELRQLRECMGSTIVYVTHDYGEALALGDRIAILHEGKIMQVGTPGEVFHHPATRLVAESLGDPPMNVLPGRICCQDGRTFVEIQGQPLRVSGAVEGPSAATPPRQVDVGIRAQHIRATQAPSSRPFHLPGQVYVHEVLGDEGLLTVTVGPQHVMVLTSPEERFTPDERVYLSWEAEAMHLFCGQTGKNLQSHSV